MLNNGDKHSAFIAAVDAAAAAERKRMFGVAGFANAHTAGTFQAPLHSPFGQSGTPTSVAPQSVQMLIGHTPRSVPSQHPLHLQPPQPQPQPLQQIQPQQYQHQHQPQQQHLQMADEEKRQQRLQRNRESARQSRRKKKQYMELLEQKVQQLQAEVDKARQAAYQNFASHEPIRAYTNAQELSVYDDTATVLDMLQSQAKGLILPRHARLYLWLAARRRVWNAKDDERLSVSRIGERHVASQDDFGNVVIEATGPLWPVLCHYLMLSVDQEERLRSVLTKLGARIAGSQEQQLLRESLQLTDRVYEQLNSSVLFTKQKMEDLGNILDRPQLEALMRWSERRRLQQIAKEKRPSPDSPAAARKYRSSEQTALLEEITVREQR